MKKYQIFVSSTYEDLKEQRSEVTKAILKLGHIPVGMEMFNASDESQWKLIQRQIDDSDYYVIIVAHRYGSRDLDGKSYTEKEYDYAASKGIPILGFIIHQDTEWLPKFIDKGKDQASLSDFKEKVKTKMVEFWSSKEMLQALVISSISVYINGNPRIGWVRAHEGNDSSVLNEVSRLSSENAVLRDELQEVNNKILEATNTKVNDIIRLLFKNYINLGIKYEGDANFNDGPEINHAEIFGLLAPAILHERGMNHYVKTLAYGFGDKGLGKLPEDLNPIAVNTLSIIFGNFVGLDLILPLTNSSYELTDLGLLVYKKLVWDNFDSK